MDFEMDSNKIFKIAGGVLILIVVILFIILLIPSKKKTNNYEVQNVILDKRSLSMNPGDSYTLNATISPSNATNQSLNYMSNNDYVATVDNFGRIKANNPGEATITVITANGKQDNCVVNVIEEKIPVTSIVIEEENITLIEGESVTLKLKVEPSNTTEHSFIWTSDSPSVAAVVDGKVTALKAGNALITVITDNKKIAICNIEVLEKVSSITLDITEKTISVGDSLQVNAKLLPLGTNAEVSWTSTNPQVATVTKGLIKAIGVGETTIIASSGKVKSEAKIKVKIISTSDIYTFKYVENQMDKPLMKCKTYTEADRIKLDDQLKRAIEKVGYGTRAGVVEAARFIVGGLDYRIPYLGPKSKEVDPDRVLGMYNKKGLNIGKSGAWGCRVNGWTQGMDCTNFVKWAFKNGGVELKGVYSNTNTHPSREVAAKIKPGDLMLSPCYSSCRFDYDYSHVGIVIGVSDKNIYVAEATTGNINSIVISVWDKNNMPAKNKFAVAKLYNYAEDGKLTDMWD